MAISLVLGLGACKARGLARIKALSGGSGNFSGKTLFNHGNPNGNGRPVGQWLMPGNTNLQLGVGGEVALGVVYGIPSRDCSGGYSAAGASANMQDYGSFIRGIRDSAQGGEVILVVEPDALAQKCREDTFSIVSRVVNTLTRGRPEGPPYVYIDAGHASWISASDMADRLYTSGIKNAKGFAVNVSNFQTTERSAAYGNEIISSLGMSKSFIIDTGRNGSGPEGDKWCNPNFTNGEDPTFESSYSNVDALLWVKPPNESDGSC